MRLLGRDKNVNGSRRMPAGSMPCWGSNNMLLCLHRQMAGGEYRERGRLGSRRRRFLRHRSSHGRPRKRRRRLRNRRLVRKLRGRYRFGSLLGYRERLARVPVDLRKAFFERAVLRFPFSSLPYLLLKRDENLFVRAGQDCIRFLRIDAEGVGEGRRKLLGSKEAKERARKDLCEDSYRIDM